MSVYTNTDTHTLEPLRPAGSRFASPDKLKHGFREVPVLSAFIKALKMQSRGLSAAAIAHLEFEDKYCTEMPKWLGLQGKLESSLILKISSRVLGTCLGPNCHCVQTYSHFIDRVVRRAWSLCYRLAYKHPMENFLEFQVRSSRSHID